MVRIGKNITSCSKKPQFFLVMCALCIHAPYEYHHRLFDILSKFVDNTNGSPPTQELLQGDTVDTPNMYNKGDRFHMAPPQRECADMDLRSIIQEHQDKKATAMAMDPEPPNY